MRIAVVDAQKKFGGAKGHQALANISLVAEDGELLVLLGPSGSGKTTLLRSIAGLESLDGGDILFGERRVNDLDPAQRDVGMVFQDYALYPHLTARENIAYSMKIRKIARPVIEQRVVEAARMLGIDPYLERKPAELSGGQRQRVAVARAITRDAQVLLMDEPLSNLDAQIREHVRVELRELQRRLGVTTIYVTHDQVEAMVMADRIAVMNEGRVEQLGVPEEIYDRPATLFCARFVGSPKINEIRGRVTREGGRVMFSLGETGEPALHLESDSDDAFGAPRPAVLAFRAEDTDLADSGLAGDVSLVENRGAEKFIVANLPAATRDAQVSADIRVRVSRRASAANAIQFLPRHAHVFDAGTGLRIAGVRCRRVVDSKAEGAAPSASQRSGAAKG